MSIKKTAPYEQGAELNESQKPKFDDGYPYGLSEEELKELGEPWSIWRSIKWSVKRRYKYDRITFWATIISLVTNTLAVILMIINSLASR